MLRAVVHFLFNLRDDLERRVALIPTMECLLLGHRNGVDRLPGFHQPLSLAQNVSETTRLPTGQRT